MNVKADKTLYMLHLSFGAHRYICVALLCYIVTVLCYRRSEFLGCMSFALKHAVKKVSRNIFIFT
jgi:hypothetical protein